MKRKALTLLLISCLSTSALLAIDFSRVAKANIIPIPEKLATDQGYIRSTGVIDPPTLPIQREGNIYRFTDNIINCTFEIERDDVVIDGNGFLLSVPAFGELDKNHQVKGANSLISISNKSNIIVKNVTFDKYSNAIDVRNSSKIIILQNTMRNGNTGVYILRSANCSLLANEISDNSLRGVLIQDCTSLDISYNTISNNGYAGIEIDDLTRHIFNGLEHSNFTRNTFSGNNYAGLYFLGHHTNNQIFENNFINNSIGLSFMGGPSVNNSFNNNYWRGNQLQINDQNIDRVDQSSLASPASTSFDPSLFPLQSQTPTSSPEPNSMSEPFPTAPIATSVASVTAASVGFFIYFKKRKNSLGEKHE